MATLPAVVAGQAPGATPFQYLVEILPNASDSWSAKRYSSKLLVAESSTFAAGLLRSKSIKGISQRANLVPGGALAEQSAVNLGFANKIITPATGYRLHDDFSDDDIAGRRVNIYLMPDSLNRLRNGSFEAIDSEDSPGSHVDWSRWTQVPASTIGTGSEWFYINAAGNHGVKTMGIDHAASDPAVIMSQQSDAFTIRRGEAITFSFTTWSESYGDNSEMRAYIIGTPDGTPSYWNPATGAFQAGKVAAWSDVRDNLIGQDFRIYAEVPASAVFTEIGAATEQSFAVLFEWGAAGEDYHFWLDEVQVDPRPGHMEGARTFCPHPEDFLVTDLAQVWAGEVDDFDWTESAIKVTTKPGSPGRNRNIPITIIDTSTATDADAPNWDVPAENDGLPFPITYGDLSGVHGSLDSVIFQKNLVLAHARLVNWDDGATRIRAYLDRPGMTLKRLGRVHQYLSGSNQYVAEMWDDTAAVPLSGTPVFAEYEWEKFAVGAYIRRHVDAFFLPGGRHAVTFYQRGRGIAYANYGANPNNWTNSANAIDGGLLSAATAGGAGNVKEILAWGHTLQVNDAELIDVYMLQKVLITNNPASGGLKHNTRRLGGPAYLQQWGSIRNGTAENIPWGIAKNWNEVHDPFVLDATTKLFSYWNNSEGQVYMGVTFVGQQASSTITLYEYGLRLDFTTEIIDADLAVDCEGRTYLTDWSASRKTVGNLIENPADIVEGFLRDELERDTADIDTDAMDTANTARASWKSAGQVWDTERSLDTLDAMAQSFHLVHYLGYDGKDKVRAIERPAAPVDRMGYGDFKRGAVKVSRTPRSEEGNEFVLHYGRRASVDEYFRKVQCNRNFQDIGSTPHRTACNASYVEHDNTTLRKEYFTPWITDDTTAQLLLQALIDWSIGRRYIVTGEVGFSRLGLELGSRFGLDLDRHLPQSVPTTTSFVVMSMRIIRERKRIKLVLLEQPVPI